MTVSAYTPNFKLALIDFNSQNWHGGAWDNLMLIDAILKADFASAPFTVASGTNALTLDYTPNIPAYTSGLTLLFKLVNAPSGAMTVNADGLGAKNLLLAGAAVASGDLLAGDVVRAIYDGTQFNIVEPVRVFAKLSLNAGSYGGSGPLATADNLVIRDGNSAGISILTPNTASGVIAFGDQDDNDVGTIVYNHNTDKLIFTSALGHSFVGSVAVTGGIAATGAITQAGNQVYHTGNLNISDYMPKTGGTFTGSFGRDGTFYFNLASGNPQIVLDTNDYWQFTRGTNTLQLFIDGGTPISAVSTGVGITGTLNVTGALTQNGNQVWHAGNLTIANYATLANPTFTGTVTLPSTTTMGGTAVLRMLSGTSGGRVKVQAQSGADYTGFVDNDFSFEY